MEDIVVPDADQAMARFRVPPSKPVRVPQKPLDAMLARPKKAEKRKICLDNNSPQYYSGFG